MGCRTRVSLSSLRLAKYGTTCGLRLRSIAWLVLLRVSMMVYLGWRRLAMIILLSIIVHVMLLIVLILGGEGQILLRTSSYWFIS